jgi:hypothetical protein
VADIPLVDLSKALSGIGNDPRLTGAARGRVPRDAGKLISERDCQHVAVKPLRCLLDPGHSPCLAVLGRRSGATCAACTNSVLTYLFPRLDILPRMVRSPVGIQNAGVATIEPNEQGAVDPTQMRSTARRSLLQDVELMPKY